MSYSYKIKLAYKGTGYFGWQVQTKGQFKTIQGELDNALKIIAKSDDVKTLGASRTDAGVHALGQVARITIPIKIPDQGIINGINSVIDPAIQVIDCQSVNGKFNPISEAISKEYLYYFTNQKKPLPFNLDYFGNISFELDIQKMQSALKCFVGKKDFLNFRCVGTETPDTIREIFEIELTQHHTNSLINIMPSSYYVLRIKGDGFLKQMVRLIVGTLWAVGRGRLAESDLHSAFDGDPKKHYGPVAPAEGLYLNKIEYKDGF